MTNFQLTADQFPERRWIDDVRLNDGDIGSVFRVGKRLFAVSPDESVPGLYFPKRFWTHFDDAETGDKYNCWIQYRGLKTANGAKRFIERNVKKMEAENGRR